LSRVREEAPFEALDFAFFIFPEGTCE